MPRLARALWDLIWLPFWLGSTLPPPALPARREVDMVRADRRPAILGQLDALRAAIWRQRAGILGFRSLWLALAVVDVGLALRVVAHRSVPLGPFLLVALATVALGAALISSARPSRGQLARTLDRSFGLRERVSTALEQTRAGRLTGLRALQVVDATRLTGTLGEARAFQRRMPVRELALTALTVIVFVALIVALVWSLLWPGRHAAVAGGGSGGQPPGIGRDGGTGPQAGAGAGSSRDGAGPQGQGAGTNQPGAGQPSAQGQHDLDAVAGALQDHAATREAADDIRSGDYAGAGDALRDAGKNAPKLSPDARQSLAGDLRKAAGQVNDPALGRDLNAAADALQKPDAAGAQEAFDNIASDVQRAGQGQSPQSSSGSGDGQNAQQPSGPQSPSGSPPDGTGQGNQPGASPRLPGDQRSQPATGPSTPLLGADGQPVQLPQGDQAGPQVPGQSGRATGDQTLPGATGAGGGNLRQGDVGETGIEVNGVPLEQRGAVERYFTPSPDKKN